MEPCLFTKNNIYDEHAKVYIVYEKFNVIETFNTGKCV
jgi:hypothetical protein